MAMQGNIFTGGGSAPVVYNYTDTLMQTGYKTFYPFKNKLVNGKMLILDKTDIDTKGIYTSEARVSNVSSLAYFDMLNQDFDLKFNVPQNLKGLYILNVPVGITVEDTITVEKPDLKLSVSTFISSAVLTPVASASFLVSGGLMTQNVAKSYYAIPEIDLPLTHVRADDYFRTHLKVEIIFQPDAQSPASAHASIMHDPKNTSLSSAMSQIIYPENNFTQLRMFLPFKIDI